RRRLSLGVRRAAERKRAAREAEEAAARARAAVLPADLRAIEAGHPVREELQPLVRAAADELVALLDHLGGPDRVTFARQALAQSVVRLGIAERGLALRYVHTADPEVASRIATIAAQRRALLVSLGLDRVAREVEDL